jgi:predicted transposase YbfD/YdcC
MARHLHHHQVRVVRADALLTQRGYSAYIVTRGGDYVWIAKDTLREPQLQQDTLAPARSAGVAAEFDPTPCAPGHNTGLQDFQTVTTINKGHGRTEKRTLTTSHCLKGYNDWPGLEQVFRLERDIRQHRSGETRREDVDGLTSLTATQAGPRRLLDLVRIHWGMENGLHARRDVTFGEDACCLRRGPAQRTTPARTAGAGGDPEQSCSGAVVDPRRAERPSSTPPF